MGNGCEYFCTGLVFTIIAGYCALNGVSGKYMHGCSTRIDIANELFIAQVLITVNFVGALESYETRVKIATQYQQGHRSLASGILIAYQYFTIMAIPIYNLYSMVTLRSSCPEFPPYTIRVFYWIITPIQVLISIPLAFFTFLFVMMILASPCMLPKILKLRKDEKKDFN